MMNNQSVSVALTNENKKPYREYGYTKVTDKCKKVEVILPFDSHYQILAKNDNAQRVKLDIDIDGTLITGTGLIVNAHSQAYIERFVETAKKLLFTKKSDDRVADPTNKENGFLTIKVTKEKLQPYTIVGSVYPYPWGRHPDQNDYSSDPYYWHTRYLFDPNPKQPSSWGSASGSTLKLSGLNDNTNSNSGATSSFTTKSVPASFTCSRGVDVQSMNCSFFSETVAETGATVEGDNSNQSFITTSWNGEETGSEVIFQFKMLGKDTKLSEQEEKDMMEYKRLKAKFEGV